MTNGAVDDDDVQTVLQSAFKQHLAQQAHSTLVFFDLVASVCEKGSSTDEVARCIRALGAPGLAPGVVSTVSACPGCADAPAKQVLTLPLPLDRQVSLGTDGPTYSSNGSNFNESSPHRRRDIDQGVTAITNGNGKKKRAKRGPVKKGTSSSDEEDSEEELRQDFSVPNLDFIDSSGNMIRGPSHLMQVLGKYCPSVGKMIVRFQTTLTERWKPLDGVCARAITSHTFHGLGDLVIAANFMFIVMQSDHRVSGYQGETQTMETAGYLFTAYYTFELCANMTVLRGDFFVGGDAGWNLFDMVIVLSAIFETLSKLLGVSGTSSTSFLRIMRFMKMARVLKMFSAMRAFKEIKVLVDALTGCLALFCFSSILLFIFMSVFAIFFVQGFAGYLEANPDLSSKEVILVHKHFGSVFGAVLTLYKCLLGGIDWGLMHSMVQETGIAYDYLFLFFMNFSLLAFLNIVVGVFCEKAMSLASTPSTEELVSIRNRKEQGDAEELLDLLHLFVEPGTTVLDSAVFDKFIEHSHVVTFFEVRGVKPSSVRRVYNILCGFSTSDGADFVAFVSTIVKLDGLPSALDVHALSVRQVQAHHNHREVLQHHQDIKDIHDLIANGLMDIQRKLSTNIYRI